MRLATVLLDGERRAAVLDGDRVGVDARPGGLDAVLAADGVVVPERFLPLAATSPRCSTPG